MKNKPWLNILLAAAMLSLACSAVNRAMGVPTSVPSAAPTTAASAAERQLAVFDAVFGAVRDQYIHADYGGVDWSALGAQYRSQVAAGQTEDAFAQTIREMLAKLPAGGAIFQTRAERLAVDTNASASYF